MIEDEMLKLKNQMCFPLYACSREVVKKYTPYLDAIGLTYTQYIAMMVLWEKQKISVKELGETLHLDSGTLTPLLKKMEKQGLVIRSRDRADERVVLITLTNQGEALKDQAKEIPGEIMKCMPLSPEDAQNLYRILYKILEQV